MPSRRSARSGGWGCARPSSPATTTRWRGGSPPASGSRRSARGWTPAPRRAGSRPPARRAGADPGDGLNDGPALAAADVGIAMSGGAASSVLVADGVVSSPSLAPVVAGIRAGRVTARLVRASQGWSVFYNALAVAAAAAGLVDPLVAAVLMPLSSGVVLRYAARVEAAVRREEAWARS